MHKHIKLMYLYKTNISENLLLFFESFPDFKLMVRFELF